MELSKVVCCDNNMDVMSALSDGWFDHTITDIPYDVVSRASGGIRVFDKREADDLTFNLENFCHEVARITKGNIAIFCSSEQVSLLVEILSKYRTYVDLAIWEKTNPSPVNGQYLWLSGVECCVVASHTLFLPEDLLWRFPSGRSKIHPTEKPLSLLKHVINQLTHQGDSVFDPCAGSGNHVLAALEVGRNGYGIELCKEFYDNIVLRLSEYEQRQLQISD